MSRKSDIYHSILVVSSSDHFNSKIKKYLTGFITIDIKKSVSLARRCILEKYYDIIVINAPLQDESGIEFAFDSIEKSNASVLFVSPREVYEDVLENVTLLFADIVRYTDFGNCHEPVEVVKMLMELFKNFDNATKACHVYKVHTIGDCYVVM